MTSGKLPPNGGESNNGGTTMRRFNGIDIGQRADGYLNATAMCKAAGKRWHDFERLDATDAFLVALAQKTGIPVIQQDHGLIQGKPGVGTWVHPQVAYHLAQWCSPAFAVQVTEWIHDIRTKGYATAPGVEADGGRLAARVETIERTLARLADSIPTAANLALLLREAFPALPREPSVPPVGYLRLPEYIAAKGIGTLSGSQKRTLSRQVRRFCEGRCFKIETGFGDAFRAGPAYPIFAMDCWWNERGEQQVRGLVAAIEAKKQANATPLFSAVPGGRPPKPA